MLKAYSFCLSEVLIIDTDKNTISFVYAGNIKSGDGETKAKENTKKITNATINKHINNYGEFVVGVPILNEYAPEYLREWDIKKDFIGEFHSWQEIQEMFIKMANATRDYFEKHGSVNEWSDIIENYVKIKQGLSEYDKKFYDEHTKDEKDPWYKQTFRRATIMNLLQNIA